jgi:hypothetical protein
MATAICGPALIEYWNASPPKRLLDAPVARYRLAARGVTPEISTTIPPAELVVGIPEIS